MAADALTPYGLAQAKAETVAAPTTIQEELGSLEHALLACVQHLDRIAPRPEKDESNIPSDGVIETLRRMRRLTTNLEERTMSLANTIGRL